MGSRLDVEMYERLSIYGADYNWQGKDLLITFNSLSLDYMIYKWLNSSVNLLFIYISLITQSIWSVLIFIKVKLLKLNT